MPTADQWTDAQRRAFADAVKTARRGANLTQMELAHALGVSQGSVSSWEKRGVVPHLSMVARLATVCGLNPNTLLGLLDVSVDPDQTARQMTGVVTEVAHRKRGGRPKKFSPRSPSRRGSPVEQQAELVKEAASAFLSTMRAAGVDPSTIEPHLAEEGVRSFVRVLAQERGLDADIEVSATPGSDFVLTVRDPAGAWQAAEIDMKRDYDISVRRLQESARSLQRALREARLSTPAGLDLDKWSSALTTIGNRIAALEKTVTELENSDRAARGVINALIEVLVVPDKEVSRRFSQAVFRQLHPSAAPTGSSDQA